MGIMGAIISDVTTLAERPRYMSLISMVTAFSIMFGAALGGVVVDYLGPRWIYFFSCFLNIALLVLFGLCYVNKPSSNKVQIDWVGMLFLALFLSPVLICTSLVYNVFMWTDPIAIILIAISLVSFFLLIWWEKNKAQSPIIPLNLFAFKTYRAAVIIIMLLLGYNSLVTTYLTLYMQTGLGFSATMSGFVSTPKGVIGIFLPGIIGAWLTANNGAKMEGRTRIANISAAFMIIISSVIFYVMGGSDLNTAYVAFIVALLIIGVGEALYKVAGQPLVQAEVPNTLLGASMAIYSFCQTLANTVYPAVFGAIYNSDPGGIVSAFPKMCIVTIAFAVLGAVASVVLLKNFKGKKAN